MYHLKGIRFGFPAIKRLGVISRLGIYPVRWNAHPAPELHFILKGQSAWEIEGEDTPLRLNGGMFTVISAGVRHRAINDRGTPAIRLGITLEELGTLTDSLPGNPFLPEDLASLYRILNAQSGVARRMPPQLETHVREFLKSLEQPSLSSAAERLHLRILAASILDAAARALLRDEQTNISREKVIETICGWIDAHCTDPDLRPERLVTLSGYGRSRFFTLFFKETGMTPRDYIMRARIEEAKRRLKGDRLITSVAIDCGFSSTSAFSSAFRRHTGFSPKDWKVRIGA